VLEVVYINIMSKKQNELGKQKYFANKDVMRHKSPIANIQYKVEIIETLKDDVDLEKYEKYKFKDLGYLVLLWNKGKHNVWRAHGFITIDELKERIGEKQYSKFCQGKREFIIQRRINGKNTTK
jgi:hypothetical protein